MREENIGMCEKVASFVRETQYCTPNMIRSMISIDLPAWKKPVENPRDAYQKIRRGQVSHGVATEEMC
jgi:hypothetical protein